MTPDTAGSKHDTCPLMLPACNPVAEKAIRLHLLPKCFAVQEELLGDAEEARSVKMLATQQDLSSTSRTSIERPRVVAHDYNSSAGDPWGSLDRQPSLLCQLQVQ